MALTGGPVKTLAFKEARQSLVDNNLITEAQTI